MFDRPMTTSRNRLRAWIDSIFVDHANFRLFWTNLAPIIDGAFYRSNHPTPRRLRRLKSRLGIKTLINLRGHRKCGSDALSRWAAAELGIKLIDMAFESRGAPHRDRILRFHEIYQSVETPVLLHCKSGADRAGLAAGLIIMFRGGTASEALQQLHWRFGHFKQARTGVLDAFFHLYQRQAEGRLSFMEWVMHEYDENGLRTSFRAARLSSFLTDKLLRRE